MTGELKSGPCPCIGVTFYSARGASILPALCPSNWLPQLSHSSLVRLPADRTNVVTMGAPLNRYGFETSLWLIVFIVMRGFKVFFRWWSMVGDSNVSEQKLKPFNACWTSFETDFVRFLMLDDDDDVGVGSLVSEWERENSLGVEIGERKGSVGERGFLWVMLGYFLVVGME